MNITQLIDVLKKVNSTEQIETDQMQELLGIGSMKFLLRDWNNSNGWSTADLASYKYMDGLKTELQVLSNRTGVKYESIVQSLRDSVSSSFYTPEPIIEAITSSIKNLEANTDVTINSVLDPAVGSGRFIGALARNFENATIVGIEKDFVSAEIAKSYTKTIPSAKILNNIYENAPYATKYDLIIGNIPFANIKVNDPLMPKGVNKFQNTLHEFYFAKSMQLLNSGGIMCFITTTGIMDSDTHRELRETMVSQLDLVSAVRLPDNIFKTEGTRVTTDVILLRKPTTNKRKKSKIEELFIQEPITDLFSSSAVVNPYYTVLSENVLGTIEVGNQYSADSGMSVKSSESIDEITSKLHSIMTNSINIYADKLLPTTKKTLPIQPEQSLLFEVKEEKLPPPTTIYYSDEYDRTGNIIGYNMQHDCVVKLGYLVDFTTKEYSVEYYHRDEVIKGNVPDKELIIANLIHLRRRTQKVLNLKAQQAPLSEIMNAQKLLNDSYNEFKLYSRGLSISQIIKNNNFNDVDVSLIESLEIQDIKTNEIKLADIFKSEFAIEVQYQPTDIKDAVIYCYNKYGKIDVEYAASLMSMDSNAFTEKALTEGIVRYDPMADNHICMPHMFRSGRVGDKIAALNKLVSGEKPSFFPSHIINEHIKELAAIKPEFVPVSKIQPQIGEVIFDVNIYRTFFAEYIKAQSADIEIVRKGDITKVLLRGYDALAKANEALQITTKGNSYFTGIDMMEALLTNKLKYFQYNISEDPLSPKFVADHYANSEFARLKEDVYTHWQQYVTNNEKVRHHIEQVYNHHNAVVPIIADGSLLDFSELNAIGITPWSYQANGISKIIESNGGLIDHPTGAGKTIVQAVAAIKMKRMGIVKKPLIGGIIANVEKIASDAKQIYPDAKILYADAKSYTKKNRHKFFAKIANNDWDLILMSHSQLEELPLNKEALIDVLNEEIENIRTNIAVLKNIEATSLEQRMTKRELAGLNTKLNNMVAKLARLNQTTDDLSLDIVKMGIDHLMIDEAHLFKNLRFETRHYRVAGINNAGSERASKLNIHLHAIRKAFYNDEDKGFTFLSATPFLNSIPEMYTLFRLCRPTVLKDMKINNFDSFIQMFAKMESDLEITVTGGYSYKSRCRYFIKTDLLLKLYHQMAHVVSPQEVHKSVGMPTKHIHHINIPRNEAQEQYLYDLMDFASDGDRNLIQRNPKNKDANGAEMLLVSQRSTLASIDMRLIDKDVYADYCKVNPDSKLNTVCNNVAAIYQSANAQRGAQLIFCDVGVPNKEKEITGEFEVYSAMKESLIELGVSSDKIVFIHDFKDDQAKRKLEDRVNAGDIRIVIGSTEKLGTGLNMQERLKAIHNIDIPWRPADFDQRTGRVERQGNTYKDVDIFFYTTEKTLDAFRFEILKHKQIFINQIKFPDNSDGSTLEDEHGDGDDIRYIDMVAEITGNPYIKEMAVTERSYHSVFADYKHAFEERSTIDFQIAGNESNISNAQVKIDAFSKALEIYDQYKIQLKGDAPIFITDTGTKLSDKDFGQYVLETISCDVEKIPHRKIATLNDNIAVSLTYHFVDGYALRVSVYDNDQQEIVNTSYNQGKIATLPQTVGLSAIKALDNITVAKAWFADRLDEYSDKRLILDGRKKSCSEEHLAKLREQKTNLYCRIQELKTIIENERRELIDESKRIKYVDIKGTTFTNALQMKNIDVQNKSDGIKINI